MDDLIQRFRARLTQLEHDLTHGAHKCGGCKFHACLMDKCKCPCGAVCWEPAREHVEELHALVNELEKRSK